MYSMYFESSFIVGLVMVRVLDLLQFYFLHPSGPAVFFSALFVFSPLLFLVIEVCKD